MYPTVYPWLSAFGIWGEMGEDGTTPSSPGYLFLMTLIEASVTSLPAACSGGRIAGSWVDFLLFVLKVPPDFGSLPGVPLATGAEASIIVGHYLFGKSLETRVLS